MIKTKRTFYSAAAGVLYYIVSLVGGLLLRRTVISVLGIEYQGIDGLFSNVITMLSIAELGVGTAIICRMYRPLAEENIPEICSLMAFYRKCYFIIAGAVLLIGLLIVPVLPWMIRDYSLNHPLFSVYIWFLMDSVVSYLFSYRRSILIADQKNYVLSLLDILYVILVKTIQITVLIYTGSYIAYLAAMVLCRLLENIVIWLITNAKYPYLLTVKAKPLSSEERRGSLQTVQGTFFHKIGYFVVLGTDNILISKFLGLFWTGVYSNYFVIINAIQNIISKVISSATASIGHLLVEQDKEKNRGVFRELQFLNLLLSDLAAVGVYCVCSDTVKFLFGEAYLVDGLTILVLSVNMWVGCMRGVSAAFKDAAGIYYQDRYIPLIESVVNIVASLLFMKRFGLAGVFMGTVTSSLILYLYSFPVLVFRDLCGGSYGEWLKEIGWDSLVFAATLFLSGKACTSAGELSGLPGLFIKAGISAVVTVICFFLFYGLWHKECRLLFRRCSSLVKGFIWKN